MRVLLTVCIVGKLTGEDDGIFMLRANDVRDNLIEVANKATHNQVAVTSFLKIKDGSAHVEFDLKGPKKHLGTFANAVILSAHGDAITVPASTGRLFTPPPAAIVHDRAIETVIADD